MSSATIAKTRDSFSSIIGQLQRGEITEHLVMNRDRVVAKLVPVDSGSDVSRRIGAAKGQWGDFDYDTFQALDEEIADMLGV